MLSRRMLLAGVAFSGFGQTPSRPTANYPGKDWAIHDRHGWSVPLLTAAVKRRYKENARRDGRAERSRGGSLWTGGTEDRSALNQEEFPERILWHLCCRGKNRPREDARRSKHR